MRARGECEGEGRGCEGGEGVRKRVQGGRTKDESTSGGRW